MKQSEERSATHGGAHGDIDAGGTVTGKYRRRPGGWLLAAALLVPLLLAMIGLYLGGAPERSTQDAAPAGQAASSAPAPVGDAITVTTAEGVRTVTATVRDESSKKVLLDGVKAASDGMSVKDEIKVDGGADGPPVAGIGTILAAGHAIPDLGVVVDRASITLSGTPSDQASGTNTVFAAGQSYPGVSLVDRLQMPAATPVASGPLPPECEQLRTDVAAQLKATPLTFVTGGSKVDDASSKRLAEIGGKLAQCPFAHIEVAGHTDDVGSDKANAVISQRRADAVRAVLVEAGVRADTITAKGYGPDKPIADNSTPEGQAANRRVEINAS